MQIYWRRRADLLMTMCRNSRAFCLMSAETLSLWERGKRSPSSFLSFSFLCCCALTRVVCFRANAGKNCARINVIGYCLESRVRDQCECAAGPKRNPMLFNRLPNSAPMRNAPRKGSLRFSLDTLLSPSSRIEARRPLCSEKKNHKFMVYLCNMFVVRRGKRYQEWIRLRQGVAVAL